MEIILFYEQAFGVAFAMIIHHTLVMGRRRKFTTENKMSKHSSRMCESKHVAAWSHNRKRGSWLRLG